MDHYLSNLEEDKPAAKSRSSKKPKESKSESILDSLKKPEPKNKDKRRKDNTKKYLDKLLTKKDPNSIHNPEKKGGGGRQRDSSLVEQAKLYRSNAHGSSDESFADRNRYEAFDNSSDEGIM